MYIINDVALELGEQNISVPLATKFIGVHYRGSVLFLDYVRLEIAPTMELRKIFVVPHRQSFNHVGDARYIGTAIYNEYGRFSKRHVFEIGQPQG